MSGISPAFPTNQRGWANPCASLFWAALLALAACGTADRPGGSLTTSDGEAQEAEDPRAHMARDAGIPFAHSFGHERFVEETVEIGVRFDRT